MLFQKHKGIGRIDKAQLGADARQMVRDQTYDILIIDIVLPDMLGIDLLGSIRNFCPDVTAIYYTMHDELWMLKQMMDSGVNGIILKSDDVSELKKAVDCVLTGESYYSKQFQSYCTVYESEQTLSMRELQVLRAIAQGQTSIEIARQLYVSPNTIEFHRKHILKKLRVTNVAELIRRGIELGYITL